MLESTRSLERSDGAERHARLTANRDKPFDRPVLGSGQAPRSRQTPVDSKRLPFARKPRSLKKGARANRQSLLNLSGERWSMARVSSSVYLRRQSLTPCQLINRKDVLHETPHASLDTCPNDSLLAPPIAGACVCRRCIHTFFDRPDGLQFLTENPCLIG